MFHLFFFIFLILIVLFFVFSKYLVSDNFGVPTKGTAMSVMTVPSPTPLDTNGDRSITSLSILNPLSCLDAITDFTR